MAAMTTMVVVLMTEIGDDDDVVKGALCTPAVDRCALGAPRTTSLPVRCDAFVVGVGGGKEGSEGGVGGLDEASG